MPAPSSLPAFRSQECRIVVMCSGNGSNFQALIDKVHARRIGAGTATIVRMYYSKAGARARDRAEAAGIPSEYFNIVSKKMLAAGERNQAKKAEARRRYDDALAQDVLSAEKGGPPDLVVLAGWMHIFTEAFLRPLAKKGVGVINLHPALPGKYDGARAIERAYEDFQAGKLENDKTGVMIHHVIAEVDRGAPILVREIEVREGDTLEKLQGRVHDVEHDLIVEATVQKVKEIFDAKQRA